VGLLWRPLSGFYLFGDRMKQLLASFVGALCALVVAGTSFADSAAEKVVTTPSGLRYVDHIVGGGAEAKVGAKVSVHYTGWLDNKGAKGTKFDSSVDRGQPFQFSLGVGQVIQGWDEGVAGMKIGGKRTLMIPSKLGYGTRGAPGAIPPNADLIFDVELLGIN